MADIIVACGSMPFGPTTLTYKSLGGSETAALMLSKALSERGHNVILFCNLPKPPEPDATPSGTRIGNLRFVDINTIKEYSQINPTDLFIAVRDPGLLTLAAQSKKKVLWAHDIFTKQGMERALGEMGWLFDEIWSVSEWHRQQIHESTGYPLKNIVALRNGVVEIPAPEVNFPRSKNTLLYAARPERGLDNLIRPGGIMDRLPEFNLKVAMYAHFPEHMKDYYAQIFNRMQQMPNVEFLGGLPQAQLRTLMYDAAAYVYPTQFEETSCILAREAMYCFLPFLTTKVGALPETLKECGLYFEHWCSEAETPEKPLLNLTPGSDEWCQAFADFIRDVVNDDEIKKIKTDLMIERNDLTWAGVAKMVEEHLDPRPVTDFSRAWSLVQDGDVIPAIEFIRSRENPTPLLQSFNKQLMSTYPFLYEGGGTMADYYEQHYQKVSSTEGNHGADFVVEPMPSARFSQIAQEIVKLAPGSRVFEFGCGTGHVLAPLAKLFPEIFFVGYDISKLAVDKINSGAEQHGLRNLLAVLDLDQVPVRQFDAVICTEVLEHTIEPWKVAEQVENFAKTDARVLITVPFGAWDPLTFEVSPKDWYDRAHIWYIDRPMLGQMFGPKKNEVIRALSNGHLDAWLRPLGQLFFAYDANHAPTNPIDPLQKALRHWPRNTAAAAVIAYNNEDTILRMLNSIDHQVQHIQIALGPSTDDTLRLIRDWAADHPWTFVSVIEVPKIEPYKFGFDHARNVSVEDLADNHEWLLWIDTDEYLSGDFRKYLRDSAEQAYIIPQHHFTVMPRGAPAEIDRPARLFRLREPYKAYGHIHEHFELPEGGPGRCFMLPDVDLGHIGYVNEGVRRDRFTRNFPFLEWEHKEGTDRKLHKFIWFRDIIHRMRFTQDYKEKLALATEGEAYYNEHYKEMASFGPGLFLSLQYLSEIYEFLGKGVKLQAQFALEGGTAQVQGRFADYAQFERVIKQLFEDEFKRRTSKYWG